MLIKPPEKPLSDSETFDTRVALSSSEEGEGVRKSIRARQVVFGLERDCRSTGVYMGIVCAVSDRR